MYIVYMDETGDSGYPGSSEYFLYTSIIVHQDNWNTFMEINYNMKKNIKDKYKIPIKQEIHIKPLLTDKNPYRQYKLTHEQRKSLLYDISQTIACLPVNIINVLINKAKIDPDKSDQYDIQERCVNYCVQRIENYIRYSNDNEEFLIISDEGRIADMVRVTRKMRKFNYIPSVITGLSYRNEIKSMIEDVLGKNSKDSFPIQLCDFVSYIAYNYYKAVDCGMELPNRVAACIDKTDLEALMCIMEPVLNKKAHPLHKFGIVNYPK